MSRDCKGMNFIKPLYRIANAMAIVPPYNTNEITKLTKHKCYSFFIIVIMLCVQGYFLLDIAIYESTAVRTTMFILDALNFALTAALLILTVFVSSFWNIEGFHSFITVVNRVDNRLEKPRKSTKKFSRFVVELLVVHFIYICCVLYDVYITVSVNEIYYYGKTVLGIVETYFVTILVLIIYNYCRVLKQRFEKLNENLQNVSKTVVILQKDYEINIVLREHIKIEETKKIFAIVNESRKIHSELVNLAEVFSRMFGWHILFLFAIIAVGVLQLFNAILLNAFYFDGAFLATLLITSYAVMGAVIAATCNMTRDEALRTTTVCYNLLLEIPLYSSDNQDLILRQELMLFAQQATYECPRFSAAGFFNVDDTVLFSLLGTVTSYVVVLIQINSR